MATDNLQRVGEILKRLVEQQANADLADYKANVPSLKDAPEPVVSLEDFKYIDANFNEQNHTFEYKLFLPYGGMLFRLDLELSGDFFSERFEPPSQEVLEFDYNSLLDDPWTEQELNEEQERQREKYGS